MNKNSSLPKTYTINQIGSKAFNCNTLLRFSDSTAGISFLIRNPFHALWNINVTDIGQHVLDILPILPVINPETQGQIGAPLPSSKITPVDTIFRRIEISMDDSIECPLIFGEHPNGAFQALTMFWDELPNRDNWKCITTDTSSETPVYKYFLKLLNKHKKMKMGFVMLLDRILSPQKSDFSSWQVNSPYVFPDTIEECNENASVMMMTDSIRTLAASQSVAIKPGVFYSLSCNMKTSNLKGYGAYIEVYIGNNIAAQSTRITGSSVWHTETCTFTSGVKDTQATIYIRMEKSRGQTSFDNIILCERNNDKNLIQNSGFEIYKAGLIYRDKHRLWIDAIGPENIVAYAPNSYKEMLRNIDQGKCIYGWENRIRIGLHGYHHTPSAEEPDPKHEFAYYDPPGDSIRINRIISDYQNLGLSTQSRKFWRSPGLQYTKSLVDQLIKNDFIFFDPGYRYDYSLYFIQSVNKRMWMPSSSIWFDKYNSLDSIQLCRVLDDGHLATCGGHPEVMFRNEAKDFGLKGFLKLDQFFSTLENNYPSMEYVFPDEWANNADAIYNYKVQNIQELDNIINIKFRGKTVDGNSLWFKGLLDEAIFDGEVVPIKVDNEWTIIILPTSECKDHTITLKKNQNQNIREENNSSNLKTGKKIYINGSSYNLLGRKLRIKQTYQTRVSNRTKDNLAAGLRIDSYQELDNNKKQKVTKKNIKLR